MKKSIALLLALVLAFGMMAGCSGGSTETQAPATEAPAATEAPEATEAPAEGTEAPADATEAPEAAGGVITKVALVTDVGTIDDESFNQATWQGVEAWCQANNIEYTYYQPTEDSTDARMISIAQAINEGANTVVMPGYLFGECVINVGEQYPDVYFIAIDVGAGDLIINDEAHDPGANTACITFSEEQAGYLAGYAAVMDGYTQLGFLGGMAVPAVQRYGYGFVQGADAAATELGVDVTINYTYGGQFFGDATITAQMEGWYSSGTEIVFACGGGIYTSAVEAANLHDGKVIGVDVDQSSIDPCIVTSAMKGLQNVTETLLDELNNGNFSNYSGKVSNYSLTEGDYVGLPTDADSWRFETFTVEQYETVKGEIMDGTRVVSNSTDAMPETTNVTVNEVG